MTADFDLTGAFNLLFFSEDINAFNEKVASFQEHIQSLSPVIEMEVMEEYEYILEIYDNAKVLGQKVINVEFPQATTKEDFVAVNANMARAVSHLEAVDRVLEICFVNNFINFY